MYDRRGKGWSEGLENDFIDSHNDRPQWSKFNVHFLKELVKVAKIKTPFYYAGEPSFFKNCVIKLEYLLR